MIECTFIADEDLYQEIKTKHIHWILLQQVISVHPQNHFILYHFSLSYTEFIKEFFNTYSYTNVTLWV